MASNQVNKFQIAGRVIEVGMPQRFSEKTSKRLLILEVTAGQFQNEVAFDFMNQNMSMVNEIVPGDWVVVDFILKGRKFVGQDQIAKWYPSLEGTNCIKEV